MLSLGLAVVLSALPPEPWAAALAPTRLQEEGTSLGKV